MFKDFGYDEMQNDTGWVLADGSLGTSESVYINDSLAEIWLDLGESLWIGSIGVGTSDSRKQELGFLYFLIIY